MIDQSHPDADWIEGLDAAMDEEAPVDLEDRYRAEAESWNRAKKRALKPGPCETSETRANVTGVLAVLLSAVVLFATAFAVGSLARLVWNLVA